MNEEIKEIFYKLKSDDYYEEHYQQSVYYERDLKKLENHITNLQKENEELLKKLEDVSLDEANIRADILLEQQDYKQRNEKAIEYIENHTENIDRGRYYEDYVETYDLLNILKGGDE